MGFKVAIAGRPNVGKSTLFNRLLGKSKAVVHDLPGVTRDALWEETYLDGTPVTLVDTGGFSKGPDPLSSEVLEQVISHIRDAQVVLFVVDSRTGPLPDDLEIAETLRRLQRKVVVCVNKVDSTAHESLLYDFYQLGFDKVVGLSALHGRGIDELKKELLRFLVPEVHLEKAPQEDLPKVTIVGRPNVGKSSVLNRIFGAKRAIVSEIPGTTRDLIDVQVTYENQGYIFLDTPGMRRKAKVLEGLEKITVKRTIASIVRSDISLLVLDANAGITDQDLKIAEIIYENFKACLVLLNKWDLLSKDRERAKDLLEYTSFKLRFLGYAPILRFSAKTGSGLKSLQRLLPQVWNAYNTRVETGKLNRALQELISEYSQVASRLKFYYATQTQTRPATIVFFVNRPELITPAYERFLKNKLREALGLKLAPLKLIFRARH